MRKVQAEPGMAPGRDGDGALVHDNEGQLVWVETTQRWVGTGRTVFDNKGNPIKQYEPFFSGTYEYEEEAELVEWGVTPILRYDGLGRLTRTDLPNGTYSKVEFDRALSALMLCLLECLDSSRFHLAEAARAPAVLAGKRTEPCGFRRGIPVPCLESRIVKKD